MDYPCLILPVTKVDSQLDIKSTREEFWSDVDKEVHELCMRHFLSSLSFEAHRIPDDPEQFEGLPVGIQLVGPSLQEEVVLGIGEVLDAALKSM